MKHFYVNDYGAIADGKTLCSKAVQRAIDDCFLSGGGTVKFGCGEYVLSTVFLKSNVKIEISQGTVILDTPSFYDFAPEEKKILLRNYIIDANFGNCFMTFGFKNDEVGVLMAKRAEFFMEDYAGMFGGRREK